MKQKHILATRQFVKRLNDIEFNFSWKIDQLRRSRSTTWIRMGSWTTMSFSNLTQRNEIKAILGSVFNQPPNLDIRFNSSILFLEMFSVSKPLLQLPLVLMFNWSSYLSSLVVWNPKLSEIYFEELPHYDTSQTCTMCLERSNISWRHTIMFCHHYICFC